MTFITYTLVMMGSVTVSCTSAREHQQSGNVYYLQHTCRIELARNYLRYFAIHVTSVSLIRKVFKWLNTGIKQIYMTLILLYVPRS